MHHPYTIGLDTGGTSSTLPSFLCRYGEVSGPMVGITNCAETATCDQVASLLPNGYPECPTTLHYLIDATGHVTDVQVVEGSITEQRRADLLATLQAMTFPCLADGEVTTLCAMLLC